MPAAPRLGLGCSRFGSLTSPLSFRDAEALVHAALHLGVRDFDTADIYGQGDSELWLGRILRDRPEARIDTKAGQRFSLKMRAMRPLKPVLKPLLRRRMSGRIQTLRARPLDLCFDPAYLEARLAASLRRLRRDRIDTFFLHNATEASIREGHALACLAELKTRGDIAKVGVSTDDAEAAELAIADGRVDALQLPLSMLAACPALAGSAASAGVSLVIREVLGGLNAANGAGPLSGAAEERRLHQAAASPGVQMVLLGTTSTERLGLAVAALSKIGPSS